MNDEPSSSAAAAYRSHGSFPEPSTAPVLSPSQLTERRKKNRRLFNRKRSEFLEDVVRSIDVLIYAELSAIYYMDCSFLRLILRAVVQFVLLTPKPALFPEPPRQRPFIGAIFGTNIFCLIIHFWGRIPSAGEQTRGYLHGGLAMDFIGQKGPTSRSHLILLDLLVLVLQITHLAAHVLRESLREEKKGAVVRRSGAAAGTESVARPAANQQTLDAEERGVRRSTEQHDIEMQNLNPSGAVATARNTEGDGARPPEEPRNDIADDDNTNDEREPFLAPTARPPDDAHIFDAFNSGQIVIADLSLWRVVMEQFWAYQEAREEEQPLTSTSPGRMLRANIAGRLLGMRFAQGGNVPNV